MNMDRASSLMEKLTNRVKALERDLTMARACIEMFMMRDQSDSFDVREGDESDEYCAGREVIERIDVALGTAPKEKK